MVYCKTETNLCPPLGQRCGNALLIREVQLHCPAVVAPSAPTLVRCTSAVGQMVLAFMTEVELAQPHPAYSWRTHALREMPRNNHTCEPGSKCYCQSICTTIWGSTTCRREQYRKPSSLLVPQAPKEIERVGVRVSRTILICTLYLC
jgi:hypothetical protein